MHPQVLLNITSSRSSSYPASEGLATLGAYKGRWYEVRVMVAPKVHIQELFLPEGLVTLATRVWLLPGMGAFMHDHVALLLAKSTQKSTI